MQTVVKGMIQAAGTAYRVVDFPMTSDGFNPVLTRAIVRVAIRGTETSWVGRLALG
jgi:hypothetical protein